ncbi:DUF4595 domain-containing protein [Bacteroides uniformis]|uniref:DUF4595 domain-containing protein n=1 Tax=Bacteroides uniformis TaxID=820 RepID=UPI001C02E41A|nr:DUF4595 domain-containing protein [Bacteroides uniformis]MBT9920345.1 DUF4595 domain-containing protein [Bacteroides uniformis]
MKTFRMIANSVLLVMLCLSFTACEDEDEPNIDGEETINPGRVFTNGLPKSAEGATMTYNEKGLLTKLLTNEGQEITFEYDNKTRAVNQSSDVRMKVVEEDGEIFIFDMQINDNGFVTHCTETEEDGDIETWDFKYTAEGNLNYMKRSEGGNEVTKIIYQNGNIIRTETISEDDNTEGYSCDVKYTSEENVSLIANKGCIMLFDQTFGVDMDEMKYAYYAGLLGKATKDLPIEITDKYSDNDEVYISKFNWTFNQSGLPTELDITNDGGYTDKIVFQW